MVLMGESVPPFVLLKLTATPLVVTGLSLASASWAEMVTLLPAAGL